jgi:tight adherence protein B
MIVIVLLVGSVFLFAWVIASVIGRALDELRARHGVRSPGDLGDVLRTLDRRSAWIVGGSLGTSGALLLLSLGAWAPGGGVFLLGILGFPSWVRHRRERWRARLEVQLVDCLQGLSAALRSGFSLPHAMQHLARENPAPLRREWEVVLREMKFGRSVDEALGGFSARAGSQEVAWIVTSVAVARQLGGNLAEVLDTIASTSRERIRIEGKIRAATSQGRMQAWIVASIPFLLGLAMFWMRPDLIVPMARHAFGWILWGAVLCMELMGLVLIRRIVRIQV